MSIIAEPVNPQELVLSQELVESVLRTGEWAIDPALKLVLDDMQLAENAEAAKQWIAGWTQAAIIYQATTTPRYWPGTQVERANIPFYTVAKSVNSLIPQIVNGLFYDDPPFIFQPRPGTSQETCEAVADVINYQLEDIDFKTECSLGVANALLYGTNLWKWGWDSYKVSRKYYAREENSTTVPSEIPGMPDTVYDDPDAPLVEKTEEYRVERPRFENITNIRDVLIDPALRVPDIRKAKYVIHRQYLTYNDLEKLRDRPGYDLPSKEEIISWFMPPAEEAIPAVDERTGINPVWDLRANPRWSDSTADPFNKPLEVLERWDEEKLIIVVQRKKVIFNGANPYGVIPFLSVNWWDVNSAFYGLGLCRTVGAEQRLQQGIVNTWLDNTALNLQGAWVRKRGRSVPTQNIRISPGSFVEVENIDDIKALERTATVPEAGQHLSLSAGRVEQNSGAGEITSQGIAGASGHSNMARSSAGAQALTAGQGVALSWFIDKFCQQVFIPFLYRAYEMNRNLLPSSVIRDLLNDELQNQYFHNGGKIEEIRNARIIFDVSAGAKLSDRRALAQSLPLITSYLGNQFVIQALAQEGKKIVTSVLLKNMLESAGWKAYYDLVVDMTPEEKQQMQQNQPAAMSAKQLAAQSQLLAQKGQQRLQEIQDINLGKAAAEVVRGNIEKGSSTLADTGEPSASDEGFAGGGNE